MEVIKLNISDSWTCEVANSWTCQRKLPSILCMKHKMIWVNTLTRMFGNRTRRAITLQQNQPASLRTLSLTYVVLMITYGQGFNICECEKERSLHVRSLCNNSKVTGTAWQNHALPNVMNGNSFFTLWPIPYFVYHVLKKYTVETLAWEMLEALMIPFGDSEKRKKLRTVITARMREEIELGRNLELGGLSIDIASKLDMTPESIWGSYVEMDPRRNMTSYGRDRTLCELNNKSTITIEHAIQENEVKIVIKIPHQD